MTWRVLEASMRRYNWAAKEQGLKFRIEIFEISDFLEGAEIFSNPKFRLLFYYYDKKLKIIKYIKNNPKFRVFRRVPKFLAFRNCKPCQGALRCDERAEGFDEETEGAQGVTGECAHGEEVGKVKGRKEKTEVEEDN